MIRFTVWWYEIDPFNGKTKRVYRDFPDSVQAFQFVREKRAAGVLADADETARLTWHHSRASLV